MSDGVLEWLASAETVPGSVLVVLLCGSDRRAWLALSAAVTTAAGALLLVPVPSTLRRLVEGDPRFGRRLLILDEVEEQPQMALRLREIGAGVYALICATAGRLWEPRFAAVVAARRPDLVVVDPGRLRVSLLLWRLELEALIARVRSLLPTARILVLAPLLGSGTGEALAAGVGGRLLRLPPVLPHHVFLHRASGLGTDKVPPLLQALDAAEGYSLVLSPTRTGAAALAATCRAAGLDVYVLHGGTPAPERTAVLGAIGSLRGAVVIATAAGLGEEGIPSPSLLAWTQLPASAEWILQAGELAAGSAVATPYLLYGDVPVSGSVSGGKRALGLEAVRRAYATVRRLARRGEALIDPERAPWQAAKLSGPTQWWAAVGLLIDAGFLVREDDTMRGATLTWRGDDLGDLMPLRQLAGLRPHSPVPLDLLVAADSLEWPVGRLLHALLDADDAGVLAIGAVRRERRYRIRPPSEASAERLRLAIESERRRGAMAPRSLHQFVSAPRCRAVTLAELAGMPAPLPCGCCDRCTRAAVAPEAPQLDERLALQALARWPGGLPEDLARRAVRQAFKRRGAMVDADRVASLLSTLRLNGLLEMRAGTLRPLLLLSEGGRQALATSAMAGEVGGATPPAGGRIVVGGE